MNIILLSGGSGKRLWPLSNEVRSKQFLKIFKKEDGSHESMVQRMYRMLKNVDPECNVTFATSESQVNGIRTQFGDGVGISIEPCRRDTFPAIALAAAYLKDKTGVDESEPVVVCPVDPYVDEDYFRALERLSTLAEENRANLNLMGIEPTYPSEKYGYVIPKTTDAVSSVESFKEKPDVPTAEKYIAQGALWNGGVFAFKLSYLLNKAHELIDFRDYNDLFFKYDTLTRISFDYAVVEKEVSISVLRFSGQWKDLGTWNTLTEAMSDPVSGNAVAGECENTHVINELQIPLVALGVKNLVIAATPDGILVTDKASSDKLKSYVSDARPMYEKRIWGEYQVLEYNKNADGHNSLMKHLIIKPGQHISYQIHRHRSEIWTIVDGTGIVIIDDEVQKVEPGSAVYIKAGHKHAVKADHVEPLHIMEVQTGDELTEEDIERLDFDWSKY